MAVTPWRISRNVVTEAMIEQAMERYTDYDPFAWLYANYWGDEFHREVVPALERLLFHRLPEGAAVLDLCCGDGRITRQLQRRGFSVTGLDGSERMLTLARQGNPLPRQRQHALRPVQASDGKPPPVKLPGDPPIAAAQIQNRRSLRQAVKQQTLQSRHNFPMKLVAPVIGVQPGERIVVGVTLHGLFYHRLCDYISADSPWRDGHHWHDYYRPVAWLRAHGPRPGASGSGRCAFGRGSHPRYLQQPTGAHDRDRRAAGRAARPGSPGLSAVQRNRLRRLDGHVVRRPGKIPGLAGV